MNASKLAQFTLSAVLAFGFGNTVLGGTGSTGGGNSTPEGDLFDLKEVVFEGKDRLVLENEVAYTQSFKGTMAKLTQAGLRSLATRMMKSIKSKPVYLTDMEINQQFCLNNQGILWSNAISAVACQDLEKIVIRRDWWKLNAERAASADPVESARGLRNQGALLSHEAMVAILFEQQRVANAGFFERAEPALREAIRRIYADTIDALDLRNLLRMSGLGKYVLESEALFAREVYLKDLPLNRCLSQDTDEFFIYHPLRAFSKMSKANSPEIEFVFIAIMLAERDALSAGTVKELCAQYKSFLDKGIFEVYLQ